MVFPITKGMEGMVISRWAFTITIGNMVMANTTDRTMPRRTTAMTTAFGQTSNEMDISRTTGIVYVIKVNLPRDLTPEFTRLSQVMSMTLNVQLPLILRSAWRRRLHLHQSHQKNYISLSNHRKRI